MPEASVKNFTLNLRRLLLFENQSGKEAAAALGINEATMSRWLTGKRYPNAHALINIDRLYGVSPRDLDDDPVAFAQKLADPARMKYAEEMKALYAKGEVTAADAEALSKKVQTERAAAAERVRGRGRKVVPIRPRTDK
jgi:transcriptional regulator with XRE-family HTH domain